jgi:hypothetical protein
VDRDRYRRLHLGGRPWTNGVRNVVDAIFDGLTNRILVSSRQSVPGAEYALGRMRLQPGDQHSSAIVNRTVARAERGIDPGWYDRSPAN